MASFHLDDNEKITLRQEVLDQLPTIKNLADGESSVRLPGRSSRLLKEVIEFVSYDNNDIVLTQALITELDFYGYEVISPTLTTEILSEAISLIYDYYNHSPPEKRLFWTWIVDDYHLKVTVPSIDISIDGTTKKAEYNWNILYRLGNFLPSHVFETLGKLYEDDNRPHTIRSMGLVAEIPAFKGEGYQLRQRRLLDQMEDEFKERLESIILTMILKDRALILRIMKVACLVITDKSVRQYFLLRLMGKR